MNDIFFYEKPLTINIEDEGSFVVFMRPLKVKDIQVLNRITHLQTIDPEDSQAASMLIGLMTSTLSIPGDELPAEATSDLITYFLQLNFPPEETKTAEEKTKELTKKKQGIAECVDFLTKQGHEYNDILNFTIPQFKKLIEVAAIRLGIKKEAMSPEDAFRKLGIPVRPRTPKDK